MKRACSIFAGYHQFFLYLYRRLVLSEDEAAASFPLREVWTPDPVWQAFIDQVLQVKPQETE
jgi:hypothetical protein